MNERENSYDRRSLAARLRWTAALVAIAAAATCWFAARGDIARLMAAYLIGFLFWWQITIGCLGLLALFHLVAARFGRAALPHLASGAAMAPLMALLFVPIATNVPAVFPWARDDANNADRHIARRHRPTEADDEQPFASPFYRALASENWPTKNDYLSTRPFVMRATGYFVIWLAIAWLLGRRTIKMAGSAGPPSPPSRPGQGLSGAALVVVVFTASFAAIDWGMSLDPHWFSTIFPATFLAGGALSALALCAASLAVAFPSGVAISPSDVAHDVGNLLLAFLMIAAYFAFSQYLIIWSGNLPEESAWFLLRQGGGWSYPVLGCVLLLYALPFAWLLSRDRKRSPRGVALLGVWLLVMRGVEVYWTIAPSLYGERFVIEPAAVAATLAIGGIWLFGYLWLLARCQTVAAAAVPCSPKTPSQGER